MVKQSNDIDELLKLVHDIGPDVYYVHKSIEQLKKERFEQNVKICVGVIFSIVVLIIVIVCIFI
jgi:hypothetical protein